MPVLGLAYGTVRRGEAGREQQLWAVGSLTLEAMDKLSTAVCLFGIDTKSRL